MANLSNINNKFIVEDSGDVGIGVTSANTKLHIGGTAPGDSIIRQDSTVSGTNWEIGERAAGKWQIFEDDGDTIVATFMSTGNVGIGTPSPSATEPTGGNLPTGWTRAGSTALEIAASDFANSGLFLRNSDTTATGTDITADQYFGDTYIDNRYNNDNGSIYFRTKTAVSPSIRMTIKGSGNVGIGTTSPDQTGYGYKTLTIMGGTSAGYAGVLELLTPSTDANGQNLGIVSFGSGGTRNAMIGAVRQSGNNNGKIEFWTSAGANGIEKRMVIDADGNVGIGTADPRGKGLEIFRAAGLSSNPQLIISTGESGSENYSLSTDVTAAGDFCIIKGVSNVAANVIMKIVNSGTTTFNGFADGDKIRWTKDGALVGSVGTYNGVPYIGYQGGAGGGIMFNGTSIEPTAIGSSRTTNTNDIGSVNYRWRNAYLGGGIYLGGTTTAHKLDYYVDTTWTPSLKFGHNDTGITYGGAAGTYFRGGHLTRIGRIVTFSFRIILTSKGTSTGQATIEGLPFPVDSLPGNYGSAMYSFANNFAIPERASITIDSGSSIIRLRFTNSSGTYGDVTNSDFNNNSDIILTGTYLSSIPQP